MGSEVLRTFVKLTTQVFMDGKFNGFMNISHVIKNRIFKIKKHEIKLFTWNES